MAKLLKKPQTLTRFDPIPERVAFGKSRRALVHRVDQARWAPKRRPDAIETLVAAQAGRVPDLLPIKWGRMSVSPFTFFRGAGSVMATDLGPRPTTGLTVQLCGDAHVRNLGAYAAPDGHIVFDVNDFDETARGPWEWDLKRLATSFVLAGREAGDSDQICQDSVLALIQSYRESLQKFLEVPAIELARYEIRRHLDEGPVHAVLRKAERATPQSLLPKLTVPPPRNGDHRRFASQPPLLTRVPETVARKVLASLREYRATLGPARQLVLDAYRPVDVAFKVVGTGSVGTRDYVVLAFGIGPKDPLFLQVKEEPASCWTHWLPKRRGPIHHGQRVAKGQHRMQTHADPFLGWTTIEGRHFLVRQLADHKASIDPQDLRGAALAEYGLVCGEVFAKAHARTGDPAALAGYCGKQDKLDRALARFAVAYADQATADFERFTSAIRKGQLHARHVS